jgi:hypothetical protein
MGTGRGDVTVYCGIAFHELMSIDEFLFPMSYFHSLWVPLCYMTLV